MYDLSGLPGRRNTRFSPTPSGQGLHVGHAWIALLNHAYARHLGGKFILRFETVVAKENHQMPADRHDCSLMRGAAEGMLEQLAWLGIEPDFISWQDMEAAVVTPFLRQFDFLPREPVPHPSSPLYGKPVSIGLHSPVQQTPWRVVSDYLLGCNPIIRGTDLMIEQFWYVSLCHMMDLPVPEIIYVPVVTFEDGRKLSKTLGATTIKQLRDQGMSAEDVLKLIRETCLKDPQGEICFKNVKTNPILRS